MLRLIITLMAMVIIIIIIVTREIFVGSMPRTPLSLSLCVQLYADETERTSAGVKGDWMARHALTTRYRVSQTHLSQQN